MSQFHLLLTLFLLLSSSLAFQSDELFIDDEEFGLEGGLPDLAHIRSSQPPPNSPPPTTTTTTRKRYSESDLDSKIQFSLEHAFGDSDFSPAGTFTARLKTWNHGGQTLTKLRFSRNDFTEVEKEKFQNLLKGDDFYRIRLPSNVLSPPGKEHIISSVKAEGVNILAVNYGALGACPHPRQLKLPAKWSFKSHTVLKNSEQAPRAPVFSEDIIGGETVEGEVVPPQERSFWAKYWMYLIPLGLIVMNAITQAMNMAEEPGAGQPQQPGAAVQRGPTPAVRRR
uniref:ER membrane protein complex subunit 10 n=1 Tax=Fagus sylvatica TaxID=28930 RepID=A0A2N9IIQ4_FAGSY